MSDEYTRDVAKRGLEAVRARREATKFGPNLRDQALQYLQSQGFGPRPQPNAGYDQWAQSRGFRPQGYQIAVGQGDGKYNGFETEGQLKAAVLGRSEALRAQDRDQADLLYDVADGYLSDIESEYTSSLGEGSQAISEQTGYNPMRAIFNQFAGMFDSDAPKSEFDILGDLQQKVARVPEVGYKQGVGAHRAELDDWAETTADPYLDALDMATMIRQTPLRDYATLAGGEYGVDPNIVGGWYPEKSQIDDFRTQRDLTAIGDYNMTDAEFQQYLDDQMRWEQQQSELDQEGYDQQVNDAIFNVTGMDADQLAQAADLTVEQLLSVVDSEPYYALNDMLGQTVAQAGGDVDEQTIREQVDEVLAQAAADPVLYRVLFSQWGGYGGAG